jgi:Tat protein secretion system quality control protein TatD with DNase activity
MYQACCAEFLQQGQTMPMKVFENSRDPTINDPSNIAVSLCRVASAYGISLEEAAVTITENFSRIFI